MIKIKLKCDTCGTVVEDKVFHWTKNHGDPVVPCRCGGMFRYQEGS